MRIADRLKELATDAGSGERQIKGVLAEICGIKYQAVQQWFLTGNPSPVNLAAIAAHYNANLMWIITGKGKKNSIALTDDEYQIIAGWRKFPPESLKMIIAQQKAFLDVHAKD
jgi:hypothetical protein